MVTKCTTIQLDPLKEMREGQDLSGLNQDKNRTELKLDLNEDWKLV